MGPIKKVAVADGELVRMLRIDQLLASPTNPRRKLGDLTELAESIKAKGVLQPILARTLQPVRTPGPGDEPEQWQIVFGHRRVAGAKKAGLTEIPAMVKAMTDREVLEAQLIENSQREDMEPLDEADGFKALHETHGCSVGELAAKIGKSEGYVYGRLKLCGLVAEAREKLQDGAFSVAVALLVARLPRVEQQRAAVKKLEEAVRYEPEGYKVTIEAAEDALEEFHLELRDAPFPLELADLVDGAGACGPCPKRSNNQPQLFAGVSPADVCTDAACFSDKRKAWLARQKAEAEAKGQKVLKAADARKALAWDSPLVALDAVVFDGGKEKAIRALVGKKHGLEVQLAPNDDGKLVEVVDRKAVNEALKKAGSKATVQLAPRQQSAPTGGNKEWQEKQAKEKAKREVEERVQAAVLDRVLKKIETDIDPRTMTTLWRFLAGVTLNIANQETIDRFLGKEGRALRYNAKKATPAIAKLDLGKVRALVVAANLDEGPQDATFRLAEQLGINRKTVAAELKAAEKAAALVESQGKVDQAVAAIKNRCAVAGCFNPKKRGGFCAFHGSKLSGAEMNAILAANKKLSRKAGADAR